jgi:hypothetical protein
MDHTTYYLYIYRGLVAPQEQEEPGRLTERDGMQATHLIDDPEGHDYHPVTAKTGRRPLLCRTVQSLSAVSLALEYVRAPAPPGPGRAGSGSSSTS